LHAAYHDWVGSVVEDTVSRESHLSILLEEFVADVIVEGELLALGVTLGLKWELHQVVIAWSSGGCLARNVGSLAGIDPGACDPSTFGTSHLSLHPPDFIEGEEGQEGHKFRLVN